MVHHDAAKIRRIERAEGKVAAQDAAAKSADDLLRNSLGTLFVYREKVKFHKRAARAQSCCNPDARLPPERLVRKVEHPEPAVAAASTALAIAADESDPSGFAP